MYHHVSSLKRFSFVCLFRQLHGVSLTSTTLFLYLFLPDYILPCYRPKQLLLLTNGSKTYSQHTEGNPTSLNSQLISMSLMPMMLLISYTLYYHLAFFVFSVYSNVVRENDHPTYVKRTKKSQICHFLIFSSWWVLLIDTLQIAD